MYPRSHHPATHHPPTRTMLHLHPDFWRLLVAAAVVAVVSRRVLDARPSAVAFVVIVGLVAWVAAVATDYRCSVCYRPWALWAGGRSQLFGNAPRERTMRGARCWLHRI